MNRLAAAGALVAFVLVGCGGGKQSDDAPPSTPAPTQSAAAPAATASPSTAPAASPTAGSASRPDPIATAQGRYKGVELQVTALTRSDDFVTINFRFVNASEDDFNEHDFRDANSENVTADDVSSAYLIDETNENKHLVVLDADGGCVCTDGIDLLAPGESQDLFAKFPAPPPDVTEMDFALNNFPNVDDIPISDG